MLLPVFIGLLRCSSVNNETHCTVKCHNSTIIVHICQIFPWYKLAFYSLGVNKDIWHFNLKFIRQGTKFNKQLQNGLWALLSIKTFVRQTGQSLVVRYLAEFTLLWRYFTITTFQTFSRIIREKKILFCCDALCEVVEWLSFKYEFKCMWHVYVSILRIYFFAFIKNQCQDIVSCIICERIEQRTAKQNRNWKKKHTKKFAQNSNLLCGKIKWFAIGDLERTSFRFVMK